MKLQYKGKKTIEHIIMSAKQEQYKIAFSPNSLIIAGDNFKALSSLLVGGYEDKVDLCYIDPPFFTDNVFTFTPDRVRTISNTKTGLIAYEDRFKQEEYFEFMRERLVLIHKLLSPCGSLYLHIDTKIGHYLKIILDEIFGADNFLNEITRKKGNPKNFQRRAYGNEKDVIYFYAKDRTKNIWNDIKIEFNDLELSKNFNKTELDGRKYTTVPVHAPGECSGVTGGEWRGKLPPQGRHWRTAPEELDKLDAAGLIEWSTNGNPRIKKFADEHKGKKVQDIWLDFKDPIYPEYPTQKNIEMLELIVQQSSNENSIVLDAFAGSGGLLRAAKKFNRKFIAIDKGEKAIQLLTENLLQPSFFDQPEFIVLESEEYYNEYMDAKEYSIS